MFLAMAIGDPGQRSMHGKLNGNNEVFACKSFHRVGRKNERKRLVDSCETSRRQMATEIEQKNGLNETFIQFNYPTKAGISSSFRRLLTPEFHPIRNQGIEKLRGGMYCCTSEKRPFSCVLCNGDYNLSLAHGDYGISTGKMLKDVDARSYSALNPVACNCSLVNERLSPMSCSLESQNSLTSQNLKFNRRVKGGDDFTKAFDLTRSNEFTVETPCCHRIEEIAAPYCSSRFRHRDLFPSLCFTTIYLSWFIFSFIFTLANPHSWFTTRRKTTNTFSFFNSLYPGIIHCWDVLQFTGERNTRCTFPYYWLKWLLEGCGAALAMNWLYNSERANKIIDRVGTIALGLKIKTRRKYEGLSVLRHSLVKSLWYLFFLACMATPAVAANSSPRFIVENSGEIVVHLKEGPDTPVGTIITTLRGYDPDDDFLTFGVEDPDGKELLDIRTDPSMPNEAQLVLRKLLDRELREEFQIILSLTDGKLGESKFITQSLLLLVEDVNDNEPIFEPFETTIMAKENAPPQVLATLRATDKDEGPYGQVVYSLSGSEHGDNSVFSVRTVNDMAELRLIGTLDYERKALYQLKILASDRFPGGRVNTGTAAIVVEVKDIEDMNPVFSKAPPVTRIPEDIPVNSYVLQVNAVDGDRGINNPIKYSIVDGGFGFFELEQGTGFLYVKRPLDREYSETGEAFFIKIRAEEGSSVVSPAPFAETEVTVVLEDVNDQTPTFRASHYVAEVSEGAQFNMPVSLIGDAIPEVYDNDQGLNGTFVLEVVGGGGLFDVTPPGGLNLASFLIRARSPELIDYEKIKVVNFTVVAKETVSTEPKSSSALVTVHIRDINDNIPEFLQSPYKVRVPENANGGYVLVTVAASDPDSGLFGTEGIRYTDIRGTFSEKVLLDPISGDISLKESSSLDRESVNEFFLTIEARDDLGKGNRNTVGVRVVLDDVNDNAPFFLQNEYQIRIVENQPVFPTPLVVSARDDDLIGTANQKIRYAIVGGDHTQNFSINEISGEINLKGPLDFEKIKMAGDDRFFNLTVKAYDLGSPPLSSLCQVLVYVADANDHQPQFERLLYQEDIPEDTSPGTSILQAQLSQRYEVMTPMMIS